MGGQDDYEIGRELGRGNFGRTHLARHLPTGALVAVKTIERGERCDRNAERECLNQRALSGLSPFVVSFREIFLTPTHLCIAMEFCSGGEVFARVARSGRLPEREARRLWRQLVAGVGACHEQGVCHRDLKLENALLDDSADPPTLKIADFGYSKSLAAAESDPRSRVGTPAYIAPEILHCSGRPGDEGYDGRAADVWSLGVFLFVLVAGCYPFEDPGRPRDVVEVVRRILAARYAFPPGLRVSPGCADLVARILVADPRRRLSLAAVRAHPWFLGVGTAAGDGDGAGGGGAADPLPPEIAEEPRAAVARHLARPPVQGMQTEEEIRALLAEARRGPGRGVGVEGGGGGGGGGRVVVARASSAGAGGGGGGK